MANLASLASRVGQQVTEPRKSNVFLIELNERDDSPVTTPQPLRFQYFPDTLTDTKAINYQTKEIPGGSLPLYQWTSSGERVITFTAQFTTDVDYLGAAPTVAATGANPLVDRIRAQGQKGRNVDIRSAVLWLRRFMLPRYSGSDQNSGVGTPLTFAPRKLKLVIPGSGIGLFGGTSPTLPINQNANSIYCIMTQCDWTFDQFFPSGLPRIASCQLSFAQTAQLAGTVAFPAATDDLDQAVRNPGTFYGYTLEPPPQRQS